MKPQMSGFRALKMLRSAWRGALPILFINSYLVLKVTWLCPAHFPQSFNCCS